jgi:predicted ribosomally synthesized peptide with SipW-like signal peptide
MLSLGAVGFLALGLGAQGTFAFWTDKATVTTGEFTSGTLDIMLDDQLVTSGPGTDAGNGFTKTTFALANAYPGESIAYSFPVKNNGTTPLTYTLTATARGTLAVADGIRYSVVFGGTPTAAAAVNTSATATAPRTGSCAGVTATDANTTPLLASATTPTTFGGTNRILAVGASEQVCIVAHFSTQAGNGLQNQQVASNAAFQFAAKQIGAPA